jgi:hypothetical protein
MTPKQKLIKLFQEHDYAKEYSCYLIAHAKDPIEFPSFKEWLAYYESGYPVIGKTIVAAGYKNTSSDRTWSTAIQVYVQVGSLKENV